MKNNYPLYATDVGVSHFPYIFKPDTKFNADGEYSVKLVLSADKAKDHIERYEQAIKDVLMKNNSDRKSQHSQYKKVDGGYEFKFKLKAKVKLKDGTDYEQRPKIYDSKNNPVTQELACYSGSEMKICYKIIPYFNKMLGGGASFMLNSVQLIKVVGTAPKSKDGEITVKDGSPFEAVNGFKVGDEPEPVPVKKNTKKSSNEVSPEEDDF